MKNKQLISDDQLQALGQLLMPSWLSGLTAVIIALGIAGSAVFALRYQGSDIQLLQQIQASRPHNIDENYVTLDDGFSGSVFLTDIPLLILWGGVGWVAYVFTMSTFGAFRKARNLEQELNYVHADRERLLREATLRIVFRLFVLILWFLYLEFTLHTLLPYAVALAYAGSGSLGWLADTGYITGAVVLLALGAHLHTVMLRLVLLKPRAL